MPTPTPALTSRNRTAAKAIALSVENGLLPDRATAREIMEMLGMIEPGGREILPDPHDLWVDPSMDDFRPLGRRNPEAEVREPQPDRSLVPVGLRELTGVKAAAASPPKAKPNKAAPTPAQRDLCGTPRGYRVHLRKHEKTCDACRAAEQLRKKGLHERSGHTGGRPATEIEHGTYAGYTKERRRGLEHCDACRAAANRRRTRNKQEQRKREKWAAERRPANPDQIVYDLTRSFEGWLEDNRAASIGQRAAAAQVRNALYELRVAVNVLERAEEAATQAPEKRTA